MDLTDINSLQSKVSKVLTIHGKIDILINNAGISYRGEIINTNVDVDIKVMLLNYFAQIALTKGKYKNLYIFNKFISFEYTTYILF